SIGMASWYSDLHHGGWIAARTVYTIPFRETLATAFPRPTSAVQTGAPERLRILIISTWVISQPEHIPCAYIYPKAHPKEKVLAFGMLVELCFINRWIVYFIVPETRAYFGLITSLLIRQDSRKKRKNNIINKP